MAHVLRDGKKFLIDSKDIVVSDLVYLDSKVSGVIPADIILYETSSDFIISTYLDSFDHQNRHFTQLRLGTILPSATNKSLNEFSEPPEFILDAPNFVPMGARLISGSGKGICIRIGNETIKALLS